MPKLRILWGIIGDFSEIYLLNFCIFELNQKKIMRVLLDIKDAQALHLMEVLKSLPYVKTTTLTEAKAQLLEELKESVDTLNQVKKGKVKLKSARDLFNEL